MEKPGVLQSMESQRVGHDLTTELKAEVRSYASLYNFFPSFCK